MTTTPPSVPPGLLAALAREVVAPVPRNERGQKAADAIRLAGGYRWVGLYEVTANEIAVVAWSGPSAPTIPRFHRSQGLNGAAVASRAPVVVQDVRNDARYLPTLGDTRGEMIVPVADAKGAIVGTIDVESAVVDAFTDRDRELLAACAVALQPLWEVA